MPRDLPQTMNGYQALAWIVWRTPKAVKRFARGDAEILWEAAKLGQWPKELGRPLVTPTVAEQELLEATRTGRLTFRKQTS